MSTSCALRMAELAVKDEVLLVSESESDDDGGGGTPPLALLEPPAATDGSPIVEGFARRTSMTSICGSGEDRERPWETQPSLTRYLIMVVLGKAEQWTTQVYTQTKGERGSKREKVIE